MFVFHLQLCTLDSCSLAIEILLFYYQYLNKTHIFRDLFIVEALLIFHPSQLLVFFLPIIRRGFKGARNVEVSSPFSPTFPLQHPNHVFLSGLGSRALERKDSGEHMPGARRPDPILIQSLMTSFLKAVLNLIFVLFSLQFKLQSFITFPITRKRMYRETILHDKHTHIQESNYIYTGLLILL